jgi:CRP/FNR family cyclic AMP-dependent transcriptional regulator
MARKKDYLDHISKVPMFSACTRKDLELLARSADEVSFDAGQTLLHEGETGREFFVIMSGAAEVSRKGKRLGTIGVGDFVGELALLDRAPRNATVTATTPVVALVLGQREFSGVLATVPAITHKLLVGMARRLHELDARV